MKKRWIVFALFISIFSFTGCGNSKTKILEQSATKATLNENGDIIINEENITSNATFLNYEVDEIQIGFIVVRGTDGIVRVAFNTCQACNPSPDAYFIQKENYLECQNCGNRFHINKLGQEKGGCNPAPVEEMTQENGIITISSEYAKTYKEKFENWNGPKA